MQMFPQRFIAFPAVYMYTTGGMRAVDPDVVVSNPKALSPPLTANDVSQPERKRQKYWTTWRGSSFIYSRSE